MNERKDLAERSALALGKAIHNDAGAINDLAGVFNDYEAEVSRLRAACHSALMACVTDATTARILQSALDDREYA